jgi:hypothetical protein
MNTAVLMTSRVSKEDYRGNFHDVFIAAFVRMLLKYIIFFGACMTSK